MKRPLFDNILIAFQNTLLAIFGAILLLRAYGSLDWRIEHDTPLLHYSALLMNKYGLIPYRDIFETSLPGTFAFHYLIGRLFGYGDTPFRYVDLMLLCGLLFATYKFMSRFSRLVAMWSAVLFGLLYLSSGNIMSLQRDYIGIIPIAFSLLCIPATMDTPVRLTRFALVGLLFGMSVLVKPHLVISLPIIFGTLLAFRWHSQQRRYFDFIKCGVITSLSFLIPICMTLIWLAANSALLQFVEMLFNYLPLYNALTGNFVSIHGWTRILYLIDNTATFGGMGALLLCSLFAYYFASIHRVDKVTTISLMCLCLCTIAYAIYPTLAGKFWQYHYMPLIYFGSVSAGLCLLTAPKYVNSHFTHKAQKILPLLILVITMAITLKLHLSKYAELLTSPNTYPSQKTQVLQKIPASNIERADEMAAWLKIKLRPNDTVQPLFGTGISIHAMLMADAKLATQFMYGHPFSHHVSSPYIQELRRSFMNQLRESSPRFITTGKSWAYGADTTPEFPELRQFINDYYKISHEGSGDVIYERKRANIESGN